MSVGTRISEFAGAAKDAVVKYGRRTAFAAAVTGGLAGCETVYTANGPEERLTNEGAAALAAGAFILGTVLADDNDGRRGGHRPHPPRDCREGWFHNPHVPGAYVYERRCF